MGYKFVKDYIPLDFSSSPGNNFLVKKLFINVKYYYNSLRTRRNNFRPYVLDPLGDMFEVLPMVGPTESFVWCFLLNMGATFNGVPDYVIEINDPVSKKKKKYPEYIPNKITSGRSIETYFHYRNYVQPR